MSALISFLVDADERVAFAQKVLLVYVSGLTNQEYMYLNEWVAFAQQIYLVNISGLTNQEYTYMNI